MAQAAETVPWVEVPDQFNATTMFVDRHLAEGRGDRVAIRYEDQALTYRQIAELTNRTGNALRELGVQMENRVLLLLLDCPEFAASFFGAIKIGAVPIPTNTLLKPRDYAYLLNDSRAAVAIVSEALAPAIEEIRPELRYLRHLVVVGQAQGDQISFAKLTAGQSTELDAAETSKDDAAFWLYSSGTTGSPKGVVHLQHDMVLCAEYYARGILNLTADDVTFSVAKLFFAYGLGNGLYFPFYVGGTAVLFAGRPEPVKIFEVIDRYQPTLFFCVPTAYAAMLQVPGAEKSYRTGSIRACVSAGEALPRAIYERWRDRFQVEILDGIGSTEILHIFLSNRPGEVRPGSSGKLVPGYDARILDEDDHEVPPGEVGNLLIKGDSTGALYWNQHEKTRQTMIGEWIRTGDKYRQDADGYFWYEGRADDMIKAGGIWVSPVEVENTLIEHPAVLEAGVIGQMDRDELVKPYAFVVLAPGRAASPELERELKDFVKGKIAPYKYPRWIEFVEELPKTATGKIQRFKLRESTRST